MKNLKTPFFTILFIFLFLFLYTKLSGPIPFTVTSVQTTKTNLFAVTGEGKATAVPNTATIAFGVTKVAPTVLDAQNQTNTNVTAITTALKNLGIDTKDLKTTNYSVYPNYDYANGNGAIKNYTVSQDMELRMKPLEKANKALDTITGNGANIVGSIVFGFDDTLKKSLTQQAREQGIEEAKEKAQNLAKLAGMKLGRIIDVQEESNAPEPMRYQSEAVKTLKMSDQQTTVTPGENTITSQVTLSYETY